MVTISDKQSNGSKIQSVKSNNILNIILIGISLYLTVQFFLYINYAANMAVFPYEVDSGEGLSLHRAIALSQGKNIYTSIDRPPYTVANYPPVYDSILAVLFNIWGPQLLIGRLVSIISAVSAGVLIALIIWLQTGKKISSIIGGLLFFSSGWVTGWSVLCRVDMLALLFSLAGLFLFILCMRTMNKTYLYSAIICLLAALFTRQSAVCVPVACMAALVVCHHNFVVHLEIKGKTLTARQCHQLAVTFAVGLMGGCLMVFGFLMVFTGAGFWRHIVTYTSGYFSWSNFFSWFQLYIWTHGISFLLSTIYIIVRGLKRDFSICELFWFFALLVTFTAGKSGASINYFLEFWAASCIVTGLVIAGLEKSCAISNRPFLKYGLVVCVILQLFQLGRFIDRTTPSAKFLASSDSINQLVHDTKGNILSEYTGYLALNGQPIYLQPFSMSQLALKGLWDQKILLNAIATKQFDLVIMSRYGSQWGRWTPDMVKMIQQHYTPIRTVSCFELHSYRHTTIALDVFVPSISSF